MPTGSSVPRLSFDDFILVAQHYGGRLLQRYPGVCNVGFQLDASTQRNLNQRILGKSWFRRDRCPHCWNGLDITADHDAANAVDSVSYTVWTCAQCRFWKAKTWTGVTGPDWAVPSVGRLRPAHHHGGIVRLAAEIEADALRVHDLTPLQLEQLVGSVLREHFNCDVRHVGRSHDGGVDLIVIAADEPIAVQVKRRRNAKAVEGVEVVRSLFASMHALPTKRGMIVTTADRFSRPANTWVRAASQRDERFNIELVAANRLFEMIVDARAATADTEQHWSAALRMLQDGLFADLGGENRRVVMPGFGRKIDERVAETQSALPEQLSDGFLVHYQGRSREGTYVFSTKLTDVCWRIARESISTTSLPTSAQSVESILKRAAEAGVGVQAIEGREFLNALHDFPMGIKESLLIALKNANPGLVEEWEP